MRINIFDIYTYDKNKLVNMCNMLNINPTQFVKWVNRTLNKSTLLVAKLNRITKHANFAKMAGSRKEAFGCKLGTETAMVSCCERILNTLDEYIEFSPMNRPVSLAEINDTLYHLDTVE